MKIIHPIDPIYDKNSKILILGSFPSVKSREEGFFYGHPRNRFWSVLADIFGENKPVTIEEKKNLLLNHNIALWDVIHSCEIYGSADSSIKNVVANDVNNILCNSKIEFIITNGKKADELYNQYIYPNTHIKSHCLPSTSPANAAWQYDRLLEEWLGYVKSLQDD